MGLRTTLSVIFPRITEAFDKIQREWITSFIRVLEDTLRNIRLDLGDMDFSADITALQGDVTDIEATIEALEARTNIQVRQTVHASKMDVDGKPDFLSINGSDVDILAADTPLIMGFANGFNENGALDYVKKISADQVGAFSGFQSLAPNYLYALLAEDGTVSYGHTPYQPQYRRAFDKTRYSLLHLEGADGSTDIIDEWGNTWTASGHAHIETDDKKFGSSSLYLDGTGDYITSTPRDLLSEFSIDMQIKPTNFTAARYIFSVTEAYTLTLGINTAGKLVLYAGTGASWSLINGGVASTALDVGAWNHVALTYDGAYYRMYANESLVYEVAKGLVLIYNTDSYGFRIGSTYNGASSFLGYIDEVRIAGNAVLVGGTTYTAPTEAYALADVYYFSIPEMKMYKVNTSFSSERALFLGECEVDGSGTPSDVTCYALNGMADMGYQYYALGAAVVFNDNMGCLNKVGDITWTQYTTASPFLSTPTITFTRKSSSFTASGGGKFTLVVKRTF